MIKDMGRIYTYMFFLAAPFALLSCGATGADGKGGKVAQPAIENVSLERLNEVAMFEQSLQETPTQVAVALFNALTDGDRFVVESNIHFPIKEEGEAFMEYYDMALESGDFKERTAGYRADYKAVSESVKGDSAYVELVGKTVLGEDTRFTVLLVKVGGWWKVDGPYSVLHRTIDRD
jgi:hypothetical protein